jgi:hypothetical protein
MKQLIPQRARSFRRAGVSPAFLHCVESRKIAGETPVPRLRDQAIPVTIPEHVDLD